MSEQTLKLMQHVVVESVVTVGLHFFSDVVIHSQQVVSQCWDHEELLHHAVHVADAAQVTQTNVFLDAIRA